MNLQAQYGVCNTPAFGHDLTHTKSVHILVSCFCKVQFSIFLPYKSMPKNWLLLLRFSNTVFFKGIFPTHPTWPASLIITVDLIVLIFVEEIPVAALSKAWVCGRSLAGTVGSNPAGGAWMPVCSECCVLSGIGPCVGLIAHPQESYRVWSVSQYVHE